MPSRLPRHIWRRLARLARSADEDEPFIMPPFGFAAHVVALAFRREATPSVKDQFCARRAVLTAWLLAALSMWLNYDAVMELCVFAG